MQINEKSLRKIMLFGNTFSTIVLSMFTIYLISSLINGDKQWIMVKLVLSILSITCITSIWFFYLIINKE